MEQEQLPQTPARQIRGPPVPNRASGVQITQPDTDTTSVDVTATDTEADRLRQQLSQVQAQLLQLQNQVASGPVTNTVMQQPHSREYWAARIDKSIKYPGEESTKGAKKAYMQRLSSYLRKSKPIWDLVSKKSKCPIITDAQAMRILRTAFGNRWKFKPSDINRSLAILLREDAATYARVQSLMENESAAGSWYQRNTTLYSTICDTMDLSRDGRDLDLLEVVDENNGLAMYDLVQFRLADIKSSDPLARAIKLKMGITHIKYEPKPHGVAKYFAAIESHRVKLAALSRPKVIGDWEVTAKALRELPPLHQEFQSVALVLKLQRNTQKTETTLEECRDAFISADNDNDVSKQLSFKPKPKSPSKKKRGLKVNSARYSKRARGDDDADPSTAKYNYGDCVHHPNSKTHATCECTNPFGFRSAFGKATSYADKCAAVKASTAAGWSPKATNVRVPQGYGCDKPQTPQISQRTNEPPTRAGPFQRQPPPLRANNARLQQTHATAIDADDLRAYNKVRAIIENNVQQRVPNMVHTPQTTAPPLRAFHAAPRYDHHRAPPPAYYADKHTNGQPGYPPRGPYQHGQPPAHPPFAAPRIHMPAPIHANVAAFPQQRMPPPTDDDLVAAGMRYFATQAGRQDFR